MRLIKTFIPSVTPVTVLPRREGRSLTAADPYSQARQVGAIGQSGGGQSFGLRLATILALTALAACGGSGQTKGTPGVIDSFGGFIGGVAVDEPRAASVARDVLSAGGSAADAAVAAYFTLAVTMPGAASLGGGGTCVVFDRNKKQTQSIMFPVRTPAAGGDIGVPGNVRGFGLLHSRYGRLRWETVLSPADQLSRLGEPASRAYVSSLHEAGNALASEPSLAAIARGPNGGLLPEGQPLRQLELSIILSRLRTAGSGDFYSGQISRQFVENASRIGGKISAEDMRTAIPEWQEPIKVTYFRNSALMFAPTVGGQYAAYMLESSSRSRGFLGTSGEIDRNNMMREMVAIHDKLDGSAPVGSSGAAGISVMDREGQAVSCAVSLGKSFGARRMVPETGILAAALPGGNRDEAPFLTVMVAGNTSVWASLAAGTGVGGAPAGAAMAQVVSSAVYGKDPLLQAMRQPRLFRAGNAGVLLHEPGATREAMAVVGDPANSIEVPRLGQINMLLCKGFLPEEPDSCLFLPDNRGYGLSFGDERVNPEKEKIDRLDARVYRQR